MIYKGVNTFETVQKGWKIFTFNKTQGFAESDQERWIKKAKGYFIVQDVKGQEVRRRRRREQNRINNTHVNKFQSCYFAKLVSPGYIKGDLVWHEYSEIWQLWNRVWIRWGGLGLSAASSFMKSGDNNFNETRYRPNRTHNPSPLHALKSSLCQQIVKICVVYPPGPGFGLFRQSVWILYKVGV